MTFNLLNLIMGSERRHCQKCSCIRNEKNDVSFLIKHENGKGRGEKYFDTFPATCNTIARPDQSIKGVCKPRAALS